MFKKFLYIILFSTLVFGLLSLLIPISFHLSYEEPIFSNAIEYCKDKDNIITSDRGTLQDQCIDKYMYTPWLGELFFSFIALICFLFSMPIFIFYLLKKIKLIF